MCTQHIARHVLHGETQCVVCCSAREQCCCLATGFLACTLLQTHSPALPSYQQQSVVGTADRQQPLLVQQRQPAAAADVVPRLLAASTPGPVTIAARTGLRMAAAAAATEATVVAQYVTQQPANMHTGAVWQSLPVASPVPPLAAAAPEAVASVAAAKEQGGPGGLPVVQAVGAELVAIEALQDHPLQLAHAAELAVHGVQAAEAAVHAEDMAANDVGRQGGVDRQEAGQGLGEQPGAADLEDDFQSANSSSSEEGSSSEDSSSEGGSSSEGSQPDGDYVIDLVSGGSHGPSSDSGTDSVDGMQLPPTVSENYDLD